MPCAGWRYLELGYVVQELQRRGVVDPARIAVGGHSYGAFMAANLLAHAPELFACGIARSGAYNRYSCLLCASLNLQALTIRATSMLAFPMQHENINLCRKHPKTRHISGFEAQHVLVVQQTVSVQPTHQSHWAQQLHPGIARHQFVHDSIAMSGCLTNL